MLLYRWFYYQPHVFIPDWKIPIGVVLENGRFIEMPRHYTDLPEDKQRLINTVVDIIKLGNEDWFSSTRKISASVAISEIQTLHIVWKEDNLEEAVRWIQKNMMPQW